EVEAQPWHRAGGEQGGDLALHEGRGVVEHVLVLLPHALVAEHAPEHIAGAELTVDLDPGDRDQALARVGELVVDDLRDAVLDQLLDALDAAFVHDGRMISSWWSSRTASRQDRKSTRLNSSHVKISYAVFCLKNKKHR